MGITALNLSQSNCSCGSKKISNMIMSVYGKLVKVPTAPRTDNILT